MSDMEDFSLVLSIVVWKGMQTSDITFTLASHGGPISLYACKIRFIKIMENMIKSPQTWLASQIYLDIFYWTIRPACLIDFVSAV